MSLLNAIINFHKERKESDILEIPKQEELEGNHNNAIQKTAMIMDGGSSQMCLEEKKCTKDDRTDEEMMEIETQKKIKEEMICDE